MFYLADTSQKIDNMIKQYVLRTLALLLSVFVRISAIPSSDSRERYFIGRLRVNNLKTRLIDGLLSKQPRFRGHQRSTSFPKKYTINFDGILLLSSEFAQRRN